MSTKTQNMRAVGVIPKSRQVGVLSHAAPQITQPKQVKVRTIECGICGTDREICNFDYGTPPNGSEYLVLAHASLGEVVEVGGGVWEFRARALVVRSDGGPCPHHGCASCQDDRQDFCVTGDFNQGGIKMEHGF